MASTAQSAARARASLGEADASNLGEAIANLVGGDLTDRARKWNCALLGGDGRIYCLPDTAPRVLCIDPSRAAQREGGVLTFAIGADYGKGSLKWSHGVVAAPVPPARYGVIYGIPYNASRVLRIDPNTATTSLIGQVYGNSDSKWRVGSLALDGKIYALPSNARRVLQIDPLTDTTRLIGRDLGGTWMKWLSCAVCSEENIYCSPGQGNKVLRIDPFSEETSLIGGDVYQMRGERDPLMCTVTVKGENSGLIYGVPRDFRTKGLLQIDPRTDMTAMIAFDEVDTTDTKWFTSSLPSDYGNNEILCCPTGSHAGAKVVFRIAAPRLMTCWTDGVRGKDDYIYGIPGSAGRILRININERTTELIGPDFGSTGVYSASWAGCVMCPGGTILCPPGNSNRVLQIDASRWKCVRHLVLLRELVRMGFAEARTACVLAVEDSHIQPSPELGNELEDIKQFLLEQLEGQGNAYSREAVEKWEKHITGFDVPSSATNDNQDDVAGVCRFIFQPELLSDDCFCHIVKFI